MKVFNKIAFPELSLFLKYCNACENILREDIARINCEKIYCENILGIMRFYIKYIARKDIAILVKLRN